MWPARIGLLHRDLKPGNVLISGSGNGLVPKVADFGLAKLLDSDGGMSRTRSGTTMGTPSHMAPEQIRDAKSVDKRADVFALGAIVYDLYCGVLAFPGDDILTVMTAIASGTYTPPRDLVPNLPGRVLRAIDGVLQVKTADRLPDCETLLATLRGAEEQSDGNLGGTPMARPLGAWSPALMASVTTRYPLSSPSQDLLRSDAPPAALRTYALSTFDLRPPAASQPGSHGTLAPPSADNPSRAEASLTSSAPSLPAPPPRASMPAWLPGVLFGVVAPAPAAVNPPPTGSVPTAPVAATAKSIVKTPAGSSTAKVASVPAPPIASPTASAPVPTVALGAPAKVTTPAANPTKATLTIAGDAKRVWLESSAGRFPAGEVPPGTYTVTAFFDGVEAVPTGHTTVAAGEEKLLRCSSPLMVCR